MAENKVYRVVCQKWLESERGWGTRPDGYSLHLTDKEREQFIKEYWDRMPDQAPDEYSRDDGDPYVCEVSEAIFKKIKESRNGIRCWGTAPYPGGTDGWIPLPSTSTKLDRATIEDLNKKTTGRHGLK
ncbi:MAG: hypothetical protein HYW89_04285 [Candidatus Sungiibacteriota bacterium]|uniref:Uncharacterized protein n=1 Tax=Candidatus Sungiibacteriota bacterium TaxID=2750080 RepID=A0A7T5RJA3_9BACT|nr:MAG: hypothetical protein HYW89_04285 [Candidatus Sungbacteria bacterium]